VKRRGFPAVHPSPAELNRETDGIRRVLFRRGVRTADLADLAQEVLLVAWTRISEGRYRPEPDADPTVALRGWLHRIAYYRGLRYRSSAQSRREELTGLGPGDLTPEPALDQLRWLEARDEFAALRHLRQGEREALLAVAAGIRLEKIAEERGMPLGVVLGWLEQGRVTLAGILGREGDEP